MKLTEIDKSNEGAFFRCLHDRSQENPRETELRRRWYDQHKRYGLRAKVLMREDDEIVGLCQYIPIEYSHLIGEDLFAILCIAVIPNQGGTGHGRFILDSIEEDARISGAKGVAAWGMNFPQWNPVSFYEHMGYERLETENRIVLVWKPFSTDAKKPSLLRPTRTPSKGSERTKVTSFLNGWCLLGCDECVRAREAVAGLEDIVDYEEVDTSDRATMVSWGIEDAVFLDDKRYRPYTDFWRSEDLRAELLKSSKR